MIAAADRVHDRAVSTKVEYALHALEGQVRHAFLRACAIDVLPLWRAPGSLCDALWTGGTAKVAPALLDDEVEQSAAQAALGTTNSWHHAARAAALSAGSEKARAAAFRNQYVCARYLAGWTALDLAPYRPIWEALERALPLTRILTWGEHEEAWVMADQWMQPLELKEGSLHDAAFAGELAVVRALLHAGKDPNARLRSERWSSGAEDPTPLNCALVAPEFDERHLEIVRVLIDAGARVDASHLGDHAKEACGVPAENGVRALLELSSE